MPTTARHSGLRRPHRMLALCAAPPGVMLELAVADARFPVVSAFNDMAVHVFPGWHASLHDVTDEEANKSAAG